jgi:hypothetical protein
LDNDLNVLIADNSSKVIKKASLEEELDLTKVLKAFLLVKQDASLLYCLYGVSSGPWAEFGTSTPTAPNPSINKLIATSTPTIPKPSINKIILFNSNLEPIHQKFIDSNYEPIENLNSDCLTTHNQRIYLLTNSKKPSGFIKKGDEQHKILSIYGTELNLIEAIGSSNKKLPFHFPLNINRLEVNEDSYMFLDQGAKKIKFMNKTSGIVVRTVSIGATTCFYNYMDKFILTFSETDKTIATYKIDNANPDSLGPKLVNHIPFKSSKELKLVKCDKEKLYFFDQQNYHLYI